MDVLPKVLKPQLLYLLNALVAALVVYFWQSLEIHILKLTHELSAQMVLILGMVLLFLLISWSYLFLKCRLYRKHLLQYDPNHFRRYEFGKWFDHFANKKDS